MDREGIRSADGLPFTSFLKDMHKMRNYDYIYSIKQY